MEPELNAAMYSKEDEAFFQINVLQATKAKDILVS